MHKNSTDKIKTQKIATLEPWAKMATEKCKLFSFNLSVLTMYP